jgi:hypothetical protein
MIRTARMLIGALRSQPLALALVVINIIVLAGFAFTLREISKSIERKDALIARCLVMR